VSLTVRGEILEEKIEGLESHINELERIAERGEKNHVMDFSGHIETVKNAAMVSRDISTDILSILRDVAERLEQLETYRG
jgi:hypothetical protein